MSWMRNEIRPMCSVCCTPHEIGKCSGIDPFKDVKKVSAIFDLNNKPPHLWTDEEVIWAKNQIKERS